MKRSTADAKLDCIYCKAKRPCFDGKKQPSLFDAQKCFTVKNDTDIRMMRYIVTAILLFRKC